jgi:hypothetical protein
LLLFRFAFLGIFSLSYWLFLAMCPLIVGALPLLVNLNRISVSAGASVAKFIRKLPAATKRDPGLARSEIGSSESA